VCDGIDNDCDGLVDEDLTASTWYQDADGDGYGNLNSTLNACTQPPGYALVPGDCDDTNPTVNPSAVEICNGVDDDCNGTVDDNTVGGATWYADQDGDNWGSPANTITACTQPLGYVINGTDCDDLNARSTPGIRNLQRHGRRLRRHGGRRVRHEHLRHGGLQVTVSACVNGIPQSCTPGPARQGVRRDRQRLRRIMTRARLPPSCPTRLTCTGTACSYVCNSGYSDCNGLTADGCEVSNHRDRTTAGPAATVARIARTPRHLCNSST